MRSSFIFGLGADVYFIYLTPDALLFVTSLAMRVFCHSVVTFVPSSSVVLKFVCIILLHMTLLLLFVLLFGCIYCKVNIFSVCLVKLPVTIPDCDV